MIAFEREQDRARIPVCVVLGARGAGKTTFVNRLARRGDLSWAVVSNENGLAAHTAELVSHVEGALVPHAVGCLCCVGRSGLVDALRRLFATRSRGPEQAFDAVVVETAQGADPAPVLQTLLNNALVTQFYRLDSVVALVDTRTSVGDLPATTSDLKQIAVADTICLTHVDASNRQELGELERRIGLLRPGATLHRIGADGAVVPVIGASYRDEFQRTGLLDRWLEEGADEVVGDREALHRFRIGLDAELSWEAFHGWLNAGLRFHGDGLYRIRGVLRLAGLDSPVIVQGVQHVLQPPACLAGWGAMTRATCLHFVTRDVSKATIADSLARDLPGFERAARDRALRFDRAQLDPSFPA